MVTEDDYIDYLAHGDVGGAIPVALAAKLRRSHFLFLGYGMRDWNLRLVLDRIWGGEPLAYRRGRCSPRPSRSSGSSGARATSTCSSSHSTTTSTRSAATLGFAEAAA